MDCPSVQLRRYWEGGMSLCRPYRLSLQKFRPLTFVSFELGDPEPLIPAHHLHRCRITCLSHQLVEMDELTNLAYREASQTKVN